MQVWCKPCLVQAVENTPAKEHVANEQKTQADTDSSSPVSTESEDDAAGYVPPTMPHEDEENNDGSGLV